MKVTIESYAQDGNVRYGWSAGNYSRAGFPTPQAALADYLALAEAPDRAGKGDRHPPEGEAV